MATIQMPSGHVVLISDEDYDRVSQYKWSLNSAGYAQRSVCGWSKQALHQFILAVPDGIEVDHKDRNPLNCQRGNLRAATRSQNQRNVEKKGNSKQKYKGISTNGAGWSASLRWNHKRIHIGTFSTEKAAGRAYDKAAHEADPEFALLNFSDGIWTEEQLLPFRLVLPPPRSGFPGVQPNGSGWAARLKRNGKNLYLGTFKTREEASLAVESARSQNL